MTWQLSVAVVHCLPSGEDVTVQEVMAEPPLNAGATQATTAVVFEATAAAPAGR